MRLIIAALLFASQQSRAHRLELRAGLDTLYSGGFPSAASYFAALAQRDSADPAPLIFEASAYMWWAAALENEAYEAPRIDSLLDRAIDRAVTAPPSIARDFWLGTALGYRARQRNSRGHAWGAAKDAKAMRDAYGRVLAADSACADCWLGLGVYEYGLARASALARFVARLVGLGSGNAERGLDYLHHAATAGDLAKVEAGWVLAAVLVREAARDPAARSELEHNARLEVAPLAERYPGNAVFQRFLQEISPSAR